MKNKFNTIGFDADDTLWINQPNYDEIENDYCNLLSKYLSEDEISEELYKTEMQNLSLYGYGAKSFMLSMIETAINITNNKISQHIADRNLPQAAWMAQREIAAHILCRRFCAGYYPWRQEPGC